MTQYLYPQNLKAKANLWLWSLRDFVILAIAALISIVILVNTGILLPAALTMCFGFLTIRADDQTMIPMFWRKGSYGYQREAAECYRCWIVAPFSQFKSEEMSFRIDISVIELRCGEVYSNSGGRMSDGKTGISCGCKQRVSVMGSSSESCER